MSYYFKLTFWKEKPEDVLDTCLSIANFYKDRDNARFYISENLMYAPTNVYNYMIESSREAKIMRLADEEWLYHLFNFKFIYWPQYKLMAMVGTRPLIPELIKKKATTIEFQNSTDQDYELGTWIDVHAFRPIVDQLMNQHLTKNQIKHLDKRYIESRYSDKVEEYDLRSSVYNHIFNMLELEKWMNEKRGNFKLMNFSSIDGQYEHADMWYMLKAMLQKKYPID